MKQKGTIQKIKMDFGVAFICSSVWVCTPRFVWICWVAGAQAASREVRKTEEGVSITAVIFTCRLDVMPVLFYMMKSSSPRRLMNGQYTQSGSRWVFTRLLHFSLHMRRLPPNWRTEETIKEMSKEREKGREGEKQDGGGGGGGCGGQYKENGGGK